MRVGRSYHSRQKRTKKASSPVKLNNQLKNGDVREKAHGKHYCIQPKSGWLLSFRCSAAITASKTGNSQKIDHFSDKILAK